MPARSTPTSSGCEVRPGSRGDSGSRDQLRSRLRPGERHQWPSKPRAADHSRDLGQVTARPCTLRPRFPSLAAPAIASDPQRASRTPPALPGTAAHVPSASLHRGSRYRATEPASGRPPHRRHRGWSRFVQSPPAWPGDRTHLARLRSCEQSRRATAPRNVRRGAHPGSRPAGSSGPLGFRDPRSTPHSRPHRVLPSARPHEGRTRPVPSLDSGIDAPHHRSGPKTTAAQPVSRSAGQPPSRPAAQPRQSASTGHHSERNARASDTTSLTIPSGCGPSEPASASIAARTHSGSIDSE
jgi:hypothetical protein